MRGSDVPDWNETTKKPRKQPAKARRKKKGQGREQEVVREASQAGERQSDAGGEIERGQDRPQVVVDFPPLIDEIDAAFSVREKPILYAWNGKDGPIIYNPHQYNASIPPQLFVHESVHLRQQQMYGDVEKWWRKYIADPQFRFKQEVPAHQAEYVYFCRSIARNRKERRLALMYLSKRLSGHLYGRLCRREYAKQLLNYALKYARENYKGEHG